MCRTITLPSCFASDKVRRRNWRWVLFFSARQRSLSCNSEQLQPTSSMIDTNFANTYRLRIFLQFPFQFLKFHFGSILGQHVGVNSKSESQSWFARHLPTNSKPTRWEDNVLNRETQRSGKRDIHRALQIGQSSGMLIGESIQMKM